ncbi:DUF3788 family protein [Enterococcus sp. LJL99]
MSEKKRLIEKENLPTKKDVQFFIGAAAWQRLICFENMLLERYELNRELKFPFGNEYGWGFRYAHRKTLLLYVFLKRTVFAVRFL